tara:strand:+ start:163 stop:1422 length:1260 start_codon:yes stop_codon:yes gene_type:complete
LANTPNTFPPKFRDDILYPAINNLDELPMPSADVNLGIYFNVNFPGFGINNSPTLTYGKHIFDVSIVPGSIALTNDGYEMDGNYPLLKNKSRILFEFKDAAGTIIFSDYTPINKPDGFSGYVWIKQDPLRTFEDIVEGPGTMTIVAVTQTSDNQWKNRYNVRMKKSIYIDLKNSSDIIYQNDSPIVFQYSTGSIGSGSGAISVTEVVTDDDSNPGVSLSNVSISASRMKTYSGEVNRIRTDVKVSGSTTNPEWQFLATHILSGSTYEDGIYKDYGQGINPISEQWSHTIPSDILSSELVNPKVKFKFTFVNPFGDTAKDVFNIYDQSQEYVLQYPNLPDTDINGWLQFNGTDTQLASETSTNPSKDFVMTVTSNGQFSFRSSENLSTSGSDGGVTYKPGGAVNIYKGGGGGSGGGGRAG